MSLAAGESAAASSPFGNVPGAMNTAAATDTWERFGAQLREIRVERGLTLRQLEELVGGELTKSAIARIEVGARAPSSRSLVDLASALNLRVTIDPAGVHLHPLGRRRRKK